MPDLPLDLFQRIADRANDPLRRTYMAGVEASARPLDVDALKSDLRQHGAPGAQSLLGALDKLQSLVGKMGGFTMMGPGGAHMFGSAPTGPQPLAPPPDQAALSAAEEAIGRPLPDEVQQLYAIGDGGFGPGEGLLPITALVAKYHELTDEPYGPLGQEWPPNLLPLFDEDPVLSCIDTDSGRMVAWDPEEIEDEESDEDWQRSFKVEHDTLAALMGSWLDQPTFEEEHG